MDLKVFTKEVVEFKKTLPISHLVVDYIIGNTLLHYND